MSERYWEASYPPDALLDWVNDNVVAAIKQFFEEEMSIVWTRVENGRMMLWVTCLEEPDGQENVLKIDILRKLQEYSMPYADIGGPRSDAQRDDMREGCAALRKLADDIVALAVSAEETI
jgi:hypothetical protein